MTDASVTLDCFALVDHRWRCESVCVVLINIRRYNMMDKYSVCIMYDKMHNGIGIVK